jgi:hypothetical protein
MDPHDLAIGLKELAHVIDRGGKREIANKNLHGYVP